MPGWRGPLVAIVLTAAAGSAFADDAVHGDRFGLTLPSGFLPAPSTPAREAATPLRDLLETLGEPALGSRRVCMRLRGTPQNPEASFVARRFILRSPDTSALGRLSDKELADAWRRYVGERPNHQAYAPQRLPVGIYAGVQLGGYEQHALGLTRWERYLVIPSEDDVLILGLTASGGDRQAWEKAWSAMTSSLTVEPRPTRSNLLPVVCGSIAIGALLMASVIALYRRLRPADPRAPAANPDALSRPPPRAVADVRTTLLPAAARLKSGTDNQPVAPAPQRWSGSSLAGALDEQSPLPGDEPSSSDPHETGRVPGGDVLELALARRMAPPGGDARALLPRRPAR